MERGKALISRKGKGLMTIKIQTAVDTQYGKAIILAGIAGIGKTTLASKMDGSIIYDVEGGAKLIECRRVDAPKTFPEIMDDMRDLFANAEAYNLKTLVVDTVDKLESIAIQDMLSSDPKNPPTIEQYGGGYGKGYTAIAQKMENFTKVLDAFREKGITVVLIAHDKVVHLDNPDTLTPYDTYSINVTKQTRPLLIAWADAVLYMARKVTTMEGNSGKTKAVRSERIVITESTAAYPDCKNRFGLSGTLKTDDTELLNALRVK